MNTTELLTISSAICPDRDAIIFESQRFSFSRLAGRVNRLSNVLADMDVKKGDKVALLQVNCNQCIEAYFATAKLGATYVPLNFRAKSDELKYMINFSEAAILLVGQRYVEMVNSIRGQLPGVKHYLSLEGPTNGMLEYESVLSDAEPEEVFTDIDDEDTTILMFTAGTTGQPKGVMLTHDNLCTYILNNVTPADPELEEKNILTVPMYHIAGMQAVLAAVYGGRTLVIQRQFEPADWMELVESEKVT
ncbi:MAG: AMP-binding protein, partial [Dehalococcoidia bacterium]